MDLWNSMSTNDSRTENNAVTHSTSNNNIVDFFFSLGAMRNTSPEDIKLSFAKAFYSDRDLAMRAMFYARDIRGGQGERNVFNACIKWLANEHPSYLTANFENIAEYGRWSDFITLFDTALSNEAVTYWAEAIRSEDPLACKWAPREKSSNRKVAVALAKTLNMPPKAYRKHLARCTKVVETQMCDKSWDDIVYSHVPSRAMKIYAGAFERNSNNFKPWLESLVKGEVKVNSKTLYPHELVHEAGKWDITEDHKALLQAMWEQLPDYFDGNTRNVLPIIDVSGSMSSIISTSSTMTCMDVAVGLGMYCALRTEGIFKNKFITFETSPRLMEIPAHASFSEKVNFVKQAPWGGNTNFQATFELILNSAVKDNLRQIDLPDIILCVSDMEFDSAGSSYAYYNSNEEDTNFQAIKQKFEDKGYTMPRLVFWNVQDRSMSNVPVKSNEDGVALISGFSPSVMKTVLTSDNFTPYTIVLDTLLSSRYDSVRVPAFG